MFTEALKREENGTYTENGALTLRSSLSECLDLFATIGALRCADERAVVNRFIRAYAEDADIAMKTLFFARDVRGGLGERKVFRTILKWLAVNEPESVRRNIRAVPEYGRYDDLLALLSTPCEADMLALVKAQLKEDEENMKKGEGVSLLAKWLPSVNTSSREAVACAKRIARGIGMSPAEYRKTLSGLRAYIRIIENDLRKKEYSFDYEKQPSRALFKYRRAFMKHDGERYQDFLKKAEEDPSVLHSAALTPYDVIMPVITKSFGDRGFDQEERKTLEATWKSLENYVGAENALAVVDGSGSMYWGGAHYMPAAVAQSLGIYFAERNKGAFHNHFITFSQSPKLVEIKGRDIVEKVHYCMSFNECANTDLAKTFALLLRTAVEHHVPQSEMPEKLYIISDMEFDNCAEGSDMTNFEHAKAEFETYGYQLPQIVFWNVNSRNFHQPVAKNAQGVALVSGCSPQIFAMLSKDKLEPYAFMMEVLSSERYEKIVA